MTEPNSSGIPPEIAMVIGGQKSRLATIKIAPAEDTNVKVLYAKALELATFAESRVISSIEDIGLAGADLGVIVTAKKAMGEYKKAYLVPLSTHLDALKDEFKRLMEPLLQAESITRAKMLGFTQDEERKAAEIQKLNQDKIELEAREAAIKGEAPAPVEITPVPSTPAKSMATPGGTFGTRLKPKWEVVDKSLIPEDYKVLDSGKITKLVNGGGSIPGIRVWYETSATFQVK